MRQSGWSNNVGKDARMLDGKVVLLSGATGGIGRATAAALAAEGATLVLTGRDQAALEGLAREIEQAGVFVLPLAADLTRPDEVEHLVRRAVRECERIDALVAAHGIGVMADGLDLATEELERMLAVNVTATFRLVQQVAQQMRAARRGGRIVLLPGTMGAHTMPKASGYAASKWATTGMAKALAQDFRRHGITFSLLYLGGVDTPFWDQIDLRVQRDQMLRPAQAAAAIRSALSQPDGAVLNEITLQPEGHQFH